MNKAFNFSNVPAGNESSSGSSESIGEQSKDIVNDSKSDNPLAGYTFVSPKELVIGQINRNYCPAYRGPSQGNYR